jgi:hypothetical protein
VTVTPDNSLSSGTVLACEVVGWLSDRGVNHEAREKQSSEAPVIPDCRCDKVERPHTVRQFWRRTAWPRVTVDLEYSPAAAPVGTFDLTPLLGRRRRTQLILPISVVVSPLPSTLDPARPRTAPTTPPAAGSGAFNTSSCSNPRAPSASARTAPPGTRCCTSWTRADASWRCESQRIRSSGWRSGRLGWWRREVGQVAIRSEGAGPPDQGRVVKALRCCGGRR